MVESIGSSSSTSTLINNVISGKTTAAAAATTSSTDSTEVTAATKAELAALGISSSGLSEADAEAAIKAAELKQAAETTKVSSKSEIKDTVDISNAAKNAADLESTNTQTV